MTESGRATRGRLGSSFYALLVATCITNLGDGLRLTALPILAATLTDSPFLIGAIVAAQFLPWTTFGPFGGVIVDRSDRRRLILVTQTWRAALMALLAIGVAFEIVDIWHLLVVAYLITVGEILVDPSVIATLPTLISPDNLDRANGQISTVETVTNNFMGGPAGALSFAVAPWLPFLLDAVSYGGSNAAFRRLPAAPGRERVPISLGAVGKDMADGVRWLSGHPFLRPVTAAIAVFHLGTAGAFGLLILLVTDTLGSTEFAYGLVLMAAAVGATLGTMIAARLTDRYSRRAVVTTAATLTALSVLASGLSGSIWQLGAAWMANGAGSGVLLSIGRGFAQRHSPNELIGRTAIAMRTITRTAFVVGALIAGAVGTSLSVRWSFVFAGTLHLLGAALLWRSFEHESAPQPPG